MSRCCTCRRPRPAGRRGQGAERLSGGRGDARQAAGRSTRLPDSEPDRRAARGALADRPWSGRRRRPAGLLARGGRRDACWSPAGRARQASSPGSTATETSGRCRRRGTGRLSAPARTSTPCPTAAATTARSAPCSGSSWRTSLRARPPAGPDSALLVCAAEEAPRFGAGTIGSRLLAGSLSEASLHELRDGDGITASQAQAEYRAALAGLPTIAPPIAAPARPCRDPHRPAPIAARARRRSPSRGTATTPDRADRGSRARRRSVDGGPPRCACRRRRGRARD